MYMYVRTYMYMYIGGANAMCQLSHDVAVDTMCQLSPDVKVSTMCKHNHDVAVDTMCQLSRDVSVSTMWGLGAVGWWGGARKQKKESVCQKKIKKDKVFHVCLSRHPLEHLLSGAELTRR
jgi:hypothetical protein